MGCSAVIGRKVDPNDRLLLQAMAEPDRKETATMIGVTVWLTAYAAGYRNPYLLR